MAAINLNNESNIRTAAQLVLPPTPLSSCVFATIIRDTRHLNLSPQDRYNHFPASPLCTVSWLFEGSAIQLANAATPLGEGTKLSNLFISGPQSNPTVSWNDGPVLAMATAIYPDALKLLTGLDVCDLRDKFIPLADVAKGEFLGCCQVLMTRGYSPSSLVEFETKLEQIWKSSRPDSIILPSRLTDWMMSVVGQIAAKGNAVSLRQLQRRIRVLTGQNQRDLKQYALNDQLFENVVKGQKIGEIELADLAADTGFSDQSHMGRFVRRMHGFSPAILNERIENDEAFWCYRLLGERF